MKLKQGMEKDYQKMIKVNTDNYSKYIIDYAISLANELEESIFDKGLKLSIENFKEADKTVSNKYNELSAMQGGIALDILCQGWLYGDELQKLLFSYNPLLAMQIKK